MRKVSVHYDLFCHGEMVAQLLCFSLKVKCLIFPLLPLLLYCLFVVLKAEIRAKASRMSIPFKCWWIGLETGGGLILLVIPTVREAARGDFGLNLGVLMF